MYSISKFGSVTPGPMNDRLSRMVSRQNPTGQNPTGQNPHRQNPTGQNPTMSERDKIPQLKLFLLNMSKYWGEKVIPSATKSILHQY